MDCGAVGRRKDVRGVGHLADQGQAAAVQQPGVGGRWAPAAVVGDGDGDGDGDGVQVGGDGRLYIQYADLVAISVGDHVGHGFVTGQGQPVDVAPGQPCARCPVNELVAYRRQPSGDGRAAPAQVSYRLR